MPSTGPFASEEDETSCLKWVLGHCKDYKRKIAEDGQFTLDAFDDLSDIDDPGRRSQKSSKLSPIARIGYWSYPQKVRRKRSTWNPGTRRGTRSPGSLPYLGTR